MAWLRLIVAVGAAVACVRLAIWTGTQFKLLIDERRSPFVDPRDPEAAERFLYMWKVNTFGVATFLLAIGSVALPLAILTRG